MSLYDRVTTEDTEKARRARWAAVGARRRTARRGARSGQRHGLGEPLGPNEKMVFGRRVTQVGDKWVVAETLRGFRMSLYDRVVLDEGLDRKLAHAGETYRRSREAGAGRLASAAGAIGGLVSRGERRDTGKHRRALETHAKDRASITRGVAAAEKRGDAAGAEKLKGDLAKTPKAGETQRTYSADTGRYEVDRHGAGKGAPSRDDRADAARKAREDRVTQAVNGGGKMPPGYKMVFGRAKEARASVKEAIEALRELNNSDGE